MPDDTPTPALDSLTRAMEEQVQQSQACANMLIGVARGLNEAQMPIMAVTLGLADALAYFGAVLVKRAYERHGAEGTTAAMTALRTRLGDLQRTFDQMAENAPKATASKGN